MASRNYFGKSDLTVVGKNHISGTSRNTGRDYDMYILYVEYEPDRKGNLLGLAVGEVLCTKELFADIAIGDIIAEPLCSAGGSTAVAFGKS